MDNDQKTQEELRERIAAAVAGSGVDLKLIVDAVAYAEARRAEGVALGRVADELRVPRWQMMDWLELANKQAKRPTKQRSGALKLKLTLELPLGGLMVAGLSEGRWLTDVASEAADRLKAWAENADRR